MRLSEHEKIAAIKEREKAILKEAHAEHQDALAAERILRRVVEEAAMDLYRSRKDGAPEVDQRQLLVTLLTACERAETAIEEYTAIAAKQRTEKEARAAERSSLYKKAQEEPKKAAKERVRTAAIEAAHYNPEPPPLVPYRETKNDMILGGQLRGNGSVVQGNIPSIGDRLRKEHIRRVDLKRPR